MLTPGRLADVSVVSVSEIIASSNRLIQTCYEVMSIAFE